MHVVYCLFWLRQYFTQEMAGLLFKVHARTYIRIVRRTINCLAAALEGEIKWPTDEEFAKIVEAWNKVLPDGMKNCVCVVDGSEWRIQRPKEQAKYYSAKKKQHSINTLFVVLLGGEIIYRTPYAKGAHDQREWNAHNIREKFIGKSYGIMGDGGFYFNRAEDTVEIKAAKPHKREQGKELTDDQKKFNRKLSQYRVVVENVIGQVLTSDKISYTISWNESCLTMLS